MNRQETIRDLGYCISNVEDVKSKFAEGYTLVAVSHGYEDASTVRGVSYIRSFFHPNKQIKSMYCYWDAIGVKREAQIYEHIFTKEEFKKFCDTYKIRIGQKHNLAEIIKEIDAMWKKSDV